MGTTLRTRLSRLAKGGEEAPLPLSPVPEGAEAKLPESDDGENGVDDKHGDNSGPRGENGGSQETFTASTKCEHEESVTEIADAVVDPHETNSVYGDVLSHLIALPFESQSMLKFHHTKESSKAKDGRRKRKKPRKNTIPIYSQKQYLRGRGLMPLSLKDLAEKESKKKKKKSRTIKSSPKREPAILHSNRNEWAEFSPRSVKTQSPKRGASQSPRQQDATNVEHLNSYNGQDMTAIQEEALAQAQQHQLLINDQRDIASLHQEQELQLLLQQQRQQQLHHQQPAYYDPLQAVHHHLYNQMSMSYPFNPYQPYQQPGYQHIPPEILQPFLHGGYVHNPDDVLAAAITAAAVANQNDQLPQTANGFAGYPKSGAEAVYRNALLPPEYHDYAAAAPAAPPTVHHDGTTDNAERKPTESKKQVVAALPQASEPTVDNDKSNADAEVSTAKRTVQDEDVANKMKMKKSEAGPKKEVGREKLTKASSDKPDMKDNAKVVHSPKAKQSGQNSDNCASKSAGAEFPPGWTTSTHPRKTGRGFNSHFVSPNNNTFRSRKSAIAFIAILTELKKKNGSNETSEAEALAVFDRRGHKR